MMISLLSSLLNIIIGSVIIESMVGGSVGAWCLVGWSVVGRSVVGGFNKTSFYLGSPLHMITSLFSNFFLFHEAILHKVLKPGFWNVKPIFLKMQLPLFSIIFLYFWLYVWIDICILICLMGLLTFISFISFGDKSVTVLILHIWE